MLAAQAALSSPKLGWMPARFNDGQAQRKGHEPITTIPLPVSAGLFTTPATQEVAFSWSEQMSKLPEAEFLSDVAGHTMQVLREDGVYRHIRFSVPGSSVYRFDLLTWPGHLCYTGDMGTYVFQRLNDMFEFFRTDRRSDDRLYTNHGYWSEKLVAVDGGRRNGSATEFSEDKFRRVINEYRVEWMRNRDLTKEQRRELWEAVDDEVLSMIDDDGGDSAQMAAHRFCWRASSYASRGPSWSFQDLFEHNFEDYTYSFRWCCLALAWGIKTYDEAKEPVSA